jgi:hypothetical protein
MKFSRQELRIWFSRTLYGPSPHPTLCGVFQYAVVCRQTLVPFWRCTENELFGFRMFISCASRNLKSYPLGFTLAPTPPKVVSTFLVCALPLLGLLPSCTVPNHLTLVGSFNWYYPWSGFFSSNSSCRCTGEDPPSFNSH